MIIAKYVFHKECTILAEGNIDMLTKFYELVKEYDSGDYIKCKDYRPRFFAVEYASVSGDNPGFVLVLTDEILSTKDINKILKS